MKNRPRVLFFGTPSFAVPILEALISLADVVAVVTQPDAPSGRGHQLRASPVKQRAETANLPISQPINIKSTDWLETMHQLKPEVAVLAAYGKILPTALLSIPIHGFLNLHPSLLPRHRGPSPVAGTILAGDAFAGVTLMLLDAEMDHGPTLGQVSLPLTGQERCSELTERLAVLGAQLISERLLPYLKGDLQPEPQDHSQATYTPLLKVTDGRIDWHEPADIIAKKIRAYDPWPGTSTRFEGAPLKILAGEAHASAPAAAPPGLVQLIDGHPSVACGTGFLKIKKLQISGGKGMTAIDFSRGHRTFLGAQLV